MSVQFSSASSETGRSNCRCRDKDKEGTGQIDPVVKCCYATPVLCFVHVGRASRFTLLVIVTGTRPSENWKEGLGDRLGSKWNAWNL